LKRRVLFWAQAFWPHIDGVTVLGTSLMLALRERGYEFQVVTSHGEADRPEETTYRGIPVHRLPFLPALRRRDVGLLRLARDGVARIKRAFEPEVVHVNFADPTVLFHLQTADVCPAALLLSICVAPPSPGGGVDTLLGSLLGRASWVAAISEAILGDIRRLAPEIAGRSSVLYNSVPSPPVAPAPLPVSAPRLLGVGRLVTDKGFDLAVAAFAAIAHRFPGARLVIAGDGPARPGLERQAAALGVADRVEFLGWVAPAEVPALMNTATLVLMPSRWREAFGLVALEAALMARPVVATRVGGLPEVVAHGRTGLVVPPEDADALAGALSVLLSSPSLAARMGRAGRRRALGRFGWGRFVGTHDALYRRLIEEGSHARAG
jgi:glycogen(starch) synthase